ncbi:MAG: ATP-binding protein, partial [Bifidobacteriaceae bacterium]|nr:ATP-binding protein [Bifidobacteriaceae bacterium]
MARLAVGTRILKRQNVIIQGPTGSGKTHVACALGNKACQQRKRVVCLPAGELFDRLVVADRAGRRRAEVDSLAKADLLIIDDWFLTAPTREHVQLVHPLIDRRHGAASTLLCAQLAPDQWRDRVEEKILADAII